MTEDRLPDYLQHILQAASDACGFAGGMRKEAFLADRRTQQAVTMNLLIIGEAAAKMLERHADFVERHPEIPWRSMRGMRNRIVHGYFDIDLGLVWETVQTALPDLLRRLAGLRGASET